jgi:hypothetical protein
MLRSGFPTIIHISKSTQRPAEQGTVGIVRLWQLNWGGRPVNRPRTLTHPARAELLENAVMGNGL